MGTAPTYIEEKVKTLERLRMRYRHCSPKEKENRLVDSIAHQNELYRPSTTNIRIKETAQKKRDCMYVGR